MYPSGWGSEWLVGTCACEYGRVYGGVSSCNVHANCFESLSGAGLDDIVEREKGKKKERLGTYAQSSMTKLSK